MSAEVAIGSELPDLLYKQEPTHATSGPAVLILMMLMLASLTRLLLHELETCHSYRIALVLTHLKPGFTPSGTRSSSLHKLVQDSWVMCIHVQIPFGISSKELRVHRGGGRRENLVW